MVDPEQWASDRANYPWTREIDLDLEVGAGASQVPLCSCSRCKAVLGTEQVEPMFQDYDRIPHLVNDTLTYHQYFLCSRRMEAFVFNTREWSKQFYSTLLPLWLALILTIVMLDVAGFKTAVFDRKMIDGLVLATDTREMITGLTKPFVREQTMDEEQTDEDNGASAYSQPQVSELSAWSADFVQGKGQGLIFLLHGKPGVGKTYTAG